MTTPTTQREADERAQGIDLGKLEAILNDALMWVAGATCEQRIKSALALIAESRVTRQAAPTVVLHDSASSLIKARIDAHTTSYAQGYRAGIEIGKAMAADEAAATDQPSTGQVDEAWAADLIGIGGVLSPQSKERVALVLRGARAVLNRASLTPTAPQAASQQAGKGCEQCDEGYVYKPCPNCAPQAATTASAAVKGSYMATKPYERLFGVTEAAPVQAAQPALPAEPCGACTGTRWLGWNLCCMCEGTGLAAPGAAQTTEKGNSHE